ncbi:glycosyltransferase family 9 protein [Campylobacter fetus]|uniref:glycosyltransferase family 9 protein n=1 Tax=Campylobacter fetus TaxID=196 RepID=UPI0003C26A51|nr:glycosyltransferase family 9 protein [Campylobacter fetus]AGZ82217.1 glycosyltransferase, family 9 [Campylobacter fetus subsp. testudinum 03-427]AJB45945.1 glycosyl transferase [Campylobacter fetus subsp. testudinum]EAI4322144.1 glycosyltransferase family 9 protein [Campylobacter fetus]EAI4391778.1 glycosyltransferase family 9 protein [Campylobacter fetus]OCS06401.1 glycosyl transferase [Campylobacter fetus subsp. testudinum]
MKILLIRNDNIGDLICTTPAIEALRKHFCNDQIDIVVNSYNKCVIKNNPFINKIYSYTKPKHKKGVFQKLKAIFGKAKMLFEIYKTGYDTAVVFRTGYSASAELFAIVSRAKKIIGVGDKNGKSRINDKVVFSGEHEVMFCFECLKSLGVRYNGEKTLFVPGTISEQYKDFVFFHISSRISQNMLNDEQILGISKFLKAKFDNVVITAEDPDFGQNISKKSGIKYLKTSSFNELASFLSGAKLLLSCDGGVMHLGPALGVKTIGILGKTDINRWSPWGAKCLQDESLVASNLNIQAVFDAVNEVMK